MFCANCGKEIEEEAVACPFCGNAVAKNRNRAKSFSDYPVENSGIEGTEEESKKSQIRRTPILLFLARMFSLLSWVGACLALGVFFWGYSQATIEITSIIIPSAFLYASLVAGCFGLIFGIKGFVFVLLSKTSEVFDYVCTMAIVFSIVVATIPVFFLV